MLSPAFGNPAKSRYCFDLRRLCGPRSREVCLYRFRLAQITLTSTSVDYKPDLNNRGLTVSSRFYEVRFLICREGLNGNSCLAESCHVRARQNPILLPPKWAKTSVVTVLQQTHNPNSSIPTRFEQTRPVDGKLGGTRNTFPVTKIGSK